MVRLCCATLKNNGQKIPCRNELEMSFFLFIEILKLIEIYTLKIL